MKNKKNKITGIAQTEKVAHEGDKNELTAEEVSKMKIAVKTYQEPERSYFSSPCMLSELEDSDEFFNQ
ncbi:MAG: hypothetical protein A2066_01160 [Bacteroidetes bacterium GWB2_41_8]|nr:MAG: hypothetical protein A2066_01160 [Bacteroidetes bacterium GWB2_41_8]